MFNKKILIIFLITFLVFQTVGSASAGANIDVSFDRDTANVGDQINIIVTITNTGPFDLSGIMVSAPLPEGLNFMMSATGTTRNIYSPETGIWDVNNLRLTSQNGGVKTLTITAEVTPELAGKTIMAKAKYESVYEGDPPVSLPLSSATSGPLKIIDPNANTGNNTGNNTNNNTGNNTSNNSGNNNNNSKINNLKDLADKLNNTGIQDIGQNEQNGQKGYEVFNNTGDNNKNTDVQSTVLGLIIIIGVIIMGYFIGTRTK